MGKYNSREFCKSVDCLMQIGIDENVAVDTAKKYCREYCKAYLFHQWLKDNNYKIVKEEDDE